MDPFRLMLALGPLAIYVLVIGRLNASRRPTVVSGVRDTVALAIALVGLVMIGPVELFMPMGAAAVFGPYVWLLLVSFYGLIVLFLLLNERPRLVIYNIPLDVLRPILNRLAAELDPHAVWAGDSLTLPNLGVDLRIEASRPLRNATLIANSDRQSFSGWQTLRLRLRHELARIEVPRNLNGFAMAAAATFAIGVLIWGLAADPGNVTRNLVQLLRL